MPGRVDRHELVALMDKGAQLIEVLDKEEYGTVHIPGAINIPLRDIHSEGVASLDKRKPVIVYCNDFL